MTTGSSLVFSAIAPHPPIMVAEVGGEAIGEVRGSIEAMAELTRRIIKSGARTVILVSPHAPLDPTAFVAYSDPLLRGNFSDFRAPEATVEAHLDEELLTSIAESAESADFEVRFLKGRILDHGTAVPLYFLLRNGWRGAVVALGYSFLGNEEHLEFGQRIRKAIEKVGRPAAFVASGDLSHRLRPEAPAGYNSIAHAFDEEVVEAIRKNHPENIIHIDPELRRMAGECGYRSMLVLLGSAGKLSPSCDVLSYEAPFGVGYLVAQVTNEGSQIQTETGPIESAASPPEPSSGNDLPALARLAVETYVRTGRTIPVPTVFEGLLAARASCFVSLRTQSGDLRGCIGTIEPVQNVLAAELIANAINACMNDPRFPPVKANELDGLTYSVDVLSTPEPATMEDLDPKRFGVIVEDEQGFKRGLLLPAIDGVDTVSSQVEIASRKAGITSGSRVALFRFSVQRFSEKLKERTAEMG